MSTSNKRTKKQKIRKTVISYAALTLFCALFSAVYEHYGHGVNSNYMIFLFLFPLLGGIMPYEIIGLLKKLRFPGRISVNLYNSGIATLTVGSCMAGVLEIYGTTSSYMPIYWIAGSTLAVAGITIYMISAIVRPQKR